MLVPVEWWHVGVALAVGLLIGLERERTGHRPAGSRTFGIAGLLGALAAAVSPYAAMAGIVAVGIVAAAAYQRTAAEDSGATTEIALVAVVVLGALAWTSPELAVGGGVAVVALLWAKSPIHHFARDIISDADERDALTFFVAAFIILPLLPDTDLGPYGALNPRRIWLIVVLLTATGWIGYIATRILGARRGLAITGLAAGFVSASAATGAMCRRARDTSIRAEALGSAVLASTSTLILLTVICWYVNAEVLRMLLPAIITGVIALGATAGAVLFRVDRVDAAEEPEPQDLATPAGQAASKAAGHPARPFAIGPALLLAGVLTVALLVGRWGADVFGSTGAIAVSALVGLADTHAGALAAAQLATAGQIPATTAVWAIAAALASNMVVKIVLAIAAGGWQVGWRYVALMAAPCAAFALALVLTV